MSIRQTAAALHASTKLPRQLSRGQRRCTLAHELEHVASTKLPRQLSRGAQRSRLRRAQIVPCLNEVASAVKPRHWLGQSILRPAYKPQRSCLGS